jgi:hypothetical protein
MFRSPLRRFAFPELSLFSEVPGDGEFWARAFFDTIADALTSI